jgi:hypothetical protein
VTATDENWAKSYAKQALSDLRARESLIKANAEKATAFIFCRWQPKKHAKLTS